MTITHRYRIPGASPRAVAAFVARRPATWLRPFLVLACGPRAEAAAPWFRFEPFAEGRARLLWRPNGEAPGFVRFVGHLAVDEEGGDAVLVLVGEAEGDDGGAGDAAAARLLELLGSALGDATSGPRRRGDQPSG
ncbi:MAG: hypothetical protein U0P45_09195 [Acidimicrobiales bacterium]